VDTYNFQTASSCLILSTVTPIPFGGRSGVGSPTEQMQLTFSKLQIRGRSQDLEGQLAVISDECSALRGALERRSQEIDELRKELDQKTAEAQRLGKESLQL
jgi:chromosome segregation ATPase